ncbi:MAG: thioredoxin domain-containing protein [Ferroplasma sp.]
MNKLANENSPYLLQHAENPVDWVPWSDEAFKTASRLNKPVFLSIGYSSCHWCHVMEEESFTDKSVAEKMNKTFVCIKVDREERPDIDNLYMTMSQIMTGTGGWPLNIILTPDKKPIFSFTYIPKNSRNNMIGLIELCDNIDDLWKNKKEELIKNGNDVINRLNAMENHSNINKLDYNKIIEKAYTALRNNYDSEYGGFGNAPKFLSFQHLLFLLRYYKKYKNENAMQMVEKSLKSMYIGGVYDHVGGGFHRYSTDLFFRIPHFEKMAYDQAMAMMAYTYAYDITGDEFYKNTVFEIFNFLKNELYNQGFYTSIDADSEKQEGKFYTWDYSELKNMVGKDFLYDFNIKPEGNFYDNYSRPSGRNILYLSKDSDIKIIAKHREELEKLNIARNKREKPAKDDKILTDINGLLINALSLAAMVFKNNEMRDLAESTADFIIHTMFKDDILYHSYRNGKASIEGMLDDYSYMVSGLLYLHEATLNKIYLNYAHDLNELVIKKFYDNKYGGFYNSSDELPARLKESYDNAIPSGFSFEINNLVVLDYIYSEYSRIIKSSVESIGEQLENQPMFFTYTVLSFFDIEAFYKIETGSGEILEYLSCHYPAGYYFIKTDSQSISVCGENRCFLVNNLEKLKKLING